MVFPKLLHVQCIIMGVGRKSVVEGPVGLATHTTASLKAETAYTVIHGIPGWIVILCVQEKEGLGKGQQN